MFVKFTCVDRFPIVLNAVPATFIAPVEDGTSIRFGEGESFTVTQPIDEVMDRPNRIRSSPRECHQQ